MRKATVTKLRRWHIKPYYGPVEWVMDKIYRLFGGLYQAPEPMTLIGETLEKAIDHHFQCCWASCWTMQGCMLTYWHRGEKLITYTVKALD